jgi:hypothetical protein
MDLDDFVFVMQSQFGVIGFFELAASGFGIELNAHGCPKHGLAACQMQYFVAVQINQRRCQRHIPIADIQILQGEIGLQSGFQITLFTGDQQIIALAVCLENN